MQLEAGRNLFRGVMILLAVAIAYWGNLTAGLALATLIGILILQSALTDWCPADLILRPLGFRKKSEVGK